MSKITHRDLVASSAGADEGSDESELVKLDLAFPPGRESR
jgi:hypothetical protein